MMYIKCCYCKKYKFFLYFYKDKSKPSGFKPRCKECEKLYINRKNRRLYEKKYRKKYPEKRRKILKKYYKNNKEKHKITQSKYRKTEQYKINHRKHVNKRRALMKNAFVEDVDYYEIYIKYNCKCVYCNKNLTFDEVEFDHFIPISKGGFHEKKNIKSSCLKCNRSKGAQMPQGGMTYQMV